MVQGFWGSDPQNFAISIGLAGRYYNSVSTAVLHCEAQCRITTITNYDIFSNSIVGITEQ